ncbi:MAG: DNA polymerase/3'-5' exonuclease PolX [Planctomycetaceae bacterium]|nr:DNA polymerase/3'-5' exonuclease PolX [Planctomycetaceae bacterium]
MPTNAEIADAFDQIADLLEFQGANPFRVRAYRNGARAVSLLSESLASIVADPDRSLKSIEGIGDDLAAKITTLVTTGSLPMLVELQAQVPHSVLALLRVAGLGPKKAAALYKELGITSLDDLKKACEEHKVQALKGFGKKTEETILAGLALAATAEARTLWAEADDFVQAILEQLKSASGVERLAAAGSYRRGKETVGDLDFLVTAADAEPVMDRLEHFGAVSTILARGDTKMSVRLRNGMQVDLRVVPAESFGAALQYFTGSKEHNVVLRGRAKDLGLKLNEYGVFRGEELVAGRTEEDVYRALDLPWFPPELREARQEFNWAAAGELPKLLELADLVGDLHMHTTATDGQASLEEMIEAAQARGLKYIAVTDHSKRVSMANGLDGARAREQWDEIDRWNAKLKGFRVLKGIECDILEKGGMDLPDDVLAEADWVVASVHYGQNQPREQITARIIGALENPHVSAIAHPTGRLINRRKPYDVDLEAVFTAAKRERKFLELNANPWRLDLDDVACAAAKAHGIPIVISTDAHSIADLSKMRYGVLQARRAGLTKADVVNTRPWDEVKSLGGKR